LNIAASLFQQSNNFTNLLNHSKIFYFYSGYVGQKAAHIEKARRPCKIVDQLLEKSTLIADRTLFLEELMIGKPHARTMMFCVPMGVGKTMLLTMAHEFFGSKTKNGKLATQELFNQTFQGGHADLELNISN
jgi:hypothetical protein